MKKLNVTVVCLWLALFALSLRPTPDLWAEAGILDEIVLRFNIEVAETCRWCLEPEMPIAEYNPLSGQYVLASSLALTDNRLIEVILKNTFGLIVFILAVINLAYYAGNGAIGRFLQMPVVRLRRLKLHRKPESDQEVPPIVEARSAKI